MPSDGDPVWGEGHLDAGGVAHEDAAARVRETDLEVVIDRYMMKEYKRLMT